MSDHDTRTYRTAAFARLAGVTPRALHHYDRLGLLKPQRSAAGYRTYTARDLERLEQIIALKFIGLPLKKIRAFTAARAASRARAEAAAARSGDRRHRRGGMRDRRWTADGSRRVSPHHRGD
jgi:DNA-binding transcriptional MerR regulator